MPIKYSGRFCNKFGQLQKIMEHLAEVFEMQINGYLKENRADYDFLIKYLEIKKKWDAYADYPENFLLERELSRLLGRPPVINYIPKNLQG